MHKFLPLSLCLLLSIAGRSQQIDPSFQFKTLTYGTISDIAQLTDGGYIFAGQMSKLNDTNVGHILKLTQEGDLNTDFVLTVPSSPQLVSVSKVIPYSDGRVLAIGFFQPDQGLGRWNIFRLRADGTVDDTFNSPFRNEGESVATMDIQSDGKIIVSGTSGEIGEVPDLFVKRLTASGSLDNTFNSPDFGQNQVINKLLVTDNDQVVVAGRFSNYDGVASANDLVRLNMDGDVDEGFGAGLSDDHGVYNIWLTSDGALYADLPDGLAKLSDDGSVDATFDPAEPITTGDKLVMKDGSVFVGGSGKLKKFDPTGALETSIDFTYDGGLLALGDDMIIVRQTVADPVSSHEIFDTDLGTITSIATLVDADETAGVLGQVFQQPDGKFLVQTDADFYSDGELHKVAGAFRLNADLSFDNTFAYDSPDNTNYMELLFVDSDGRIYFNNKVLGNDMLYRLTSDGAKDMSFTPVPGIFADVAELKNNSGFIASRGGKLSGSFAIVKFGESGSDDPEVVYTSNYYMPTIDIASTGELYITKSNGVFLKFTPDGETVTEFSSYVPGLDYPRAAIYDDDLFVVNAYYTDINALVLFPLIEWNADGTFQKFQNSSFDSKFGRYVVVDQQTGEVYLLNQLGGLSGSDFEVMRLKKDGTIDKRFIKVDYELANIFADGARVFLLNDRSLLITGQKVYHVVIPDAIPESATDTKLTLDGDVLKVEWTDNSDNESIFEIERSSDGEIFTLVGTVATNATSYSEVRPVDGTYTYRVIAANARGAAEGYDEESIEIVTTGLFEAEASFKAYPNPVKHQLQVTTNESIERCSIFLPDGRMLESSTPRSNDFQINMSGYASGLYVLQLEGFSGKRTIKIFKQ